MTPWPLQRRPTDRAYRNGLAAADTCFLAAVQHLYKQKLVQREVPTAADEGRGMPVHLTAGWMCMYRQAGHGGLKQQVLIMLQGRVVRLGGMQACLHVDMLTHRSGKICQDLDPGSGSMGHASSCRALAHTKQSCLGTGSCSTGVKMAWGPFWHLCRPGEQTLLT